MWFAKEDDLSFEISIIFEWSYKSQLFQVTRSLKQPLIHKNSAPKQTAKERYALTWYNKQKNLKKTRVKTITLQADLS